MNNNKPWFDANQIRYKAVREGMIELMAILIDRIGEFDPDILGADPRKSLFRINRDVRFSKDKSPYKTNIGATIGAGSKDAAGGYYFHFDPENSFVASGMYMPMPPELQALRQQIDLNADALRGIIADPDFVRYFGDLQGEKLKNAPKGYEKDHPNLDLLRHKAMYVSGVINSDELDSDDLIDILVNRIRVVHEFALFIRQTIK